jgi:hypothetical protein
MKNSIPAFDQLYDEYKKEVGKLSGDLIQTNKGEFLKMYAFYRSIIFKDMNVQLNELRCSVYNNK